MFRIRSLIAAVLLVPLSLHAQKQVQPSTTRPVPTTFPVLLSTFLADSGVATRGITWAVAGNLPVMWTTTKPTAPAYDVGQGITMQHQGAVRVEVSDTSAVEMTLFVYGNSSGIQRVAVSWDMQALQGAAAEALLTDAGWTLKSLKCARESEGYSYGNLLYAVKAPGKTASGLHEDWNCAQEDCAIAMTIYYRKAELPQIECAGA